MEGERLGVEMVTKDVGDDTVCFSFQVWNLKGAWNVLHGSKREVGIKSNGLVNINIIVSYQTNPNGCDCLCCCLRTYPKPELWNYLYHIVGQQLNKTILYRWQLLRRFFVKLWSALKPQVAVL